MKLGEHLRKSPAKSEENHEGTSKPLLPMHWNIVLLRLALSVSRASRSGRSGKQVLSDVAKQVKSEPLA